jgi:KUP system potassium uptake protein
VFLCATGGEALYADMGHIGRFPIRLAWYGIVLPSLMLSYAGQTGLLLEGAANESNPFFLLAPSWAVVPLVVLATLATIIASQAIITGSFSMTRQGMQLGWLPGFDIRQTSDAIYGQIYVPGVNLMMALATIGIAIGFRTSSNLAGAYGTAVATTMVLTTLLLFRAMYRIWRWPAIVVIPLASLFLTIDGGFFVANLMKVADGGWIPLSLGVLLFGIMVTWHTGVKMLRARLAGLARPANHFLTELSDNRIPRIPGTAVFLTRTADHIPAFVTEYVRNIGSLHKSVIALSIRFEDQPRILQNRCNVEPIIDSVWRVTLRYGFIEIPHIQRDLQKVPDLAAELDMRHVVFFASRDLVKPDRHSLLTKWWLGIFAFLYRNAVRATDRFNLPQDRTVEIVHLVTL